MPMYAKKKSIEDLAKNLPEDIKLTIMAYGELFNKKYIMPLLTTTDKDFDWRFQYSVSGLYSYLLSISDIIIRKQNQYPNLLKDLMEYNVTALRELGHQLLIIDDKKYQDIIFNSLGIIQQYSQLSTEPKIESFLNKTEYVPAVQSMVYVLVCLVAFVQIVIKRKPFKGKIFKLLLENLQKHSTELESYLETVEIESDPDQMTIFEKTKNFK